MMQINITLTESASTYYQQHLLSHHQEAVGLRLSLTQSGCAGLEYDITTVLKPQDDDLVAHAQPKLFVCRKAAPMLNGLVIDYISGPLDQGEIIFKNPQAAESCGCGKSFSINATPQEGAVKDA